jgi:hypothetical protein
MAEQKFFKELELGFRELFRILIPGAYAVSLAQVVAPNASFSQTLLKTTASGLAATFFLGLIGYALRVHERWFPYYRYFEKQRASLNNEIARIAAVSPETDNVDFYKYFLETSAESLNDRIHYFSSFYYMLVELSLFSVAAAYVILANFLFTRVSISSTAAAAAAWSIALACIIQLVAVFALTGIRNTRTKYAVIAAPVLALVALVIMVMSGYRHGTPVVHAFACGLGPAPLILVVMSYLFWRLGEKHWKQIVREQIVLVNDRATDLIKVSRKYSPTTTTPS